VVSGSDRPPSTAYRPHRGDHPGQARADRTQGDEGPQEQACGVGEVVRGTARRRSAEPGPFPDLTPRERDVLGLLATGLGNHAIARSLGLAEKTVRNHVSSLLVKLAVPTRAAAVAKARDSGVGAPR
jgi:DNA-binding NarL/FixJ family response regulator